MIAPYKGTFRVSQPYKPGTHNGIDLVGVSSKRLYAVCRGYIGTSTMITDKSNRTWQWGNYVKLVADGDKLIPDGTLIYYCHLSARSVKKGDRVEKGDAIGTEGNTGYSFGSHCHLEIRSSSNRVTDAVNSVSITGIENVRGTYEYLPNGKELTLTQYEELKSRIASLEAGITALKTSIGELRSNVSELDGNLRKAGARYATVKDLPLWARDTIAKVVAEGKLIGGQDGNLNLSDDLVRILYILKKQGLI